MPPKKDAKKGAAKELDPSIYVRKVNWFVHYSRSSLLLTVFSSIVPVLR
jgi:hypothetical protein